MQTLLIHVGRASDPATKTALAVALERLGEPKARSFCTKDWREKTPSCDFCRRSCSVIAAIEPRSSFAVGAGKGQVGGPIELSVLGCLARSGNDASYKALLVRLQRSEPREAKPQRRRSSLSRLAKRGRRCCSTNWQRSPDATSCWRLAIWRRRSIRKRRRYFGL